MKKLFIILLIILLIPASATAGALVASYTDVKVTVDGQAVNTPVYAINGRNYASAADVAKALGASVQWKDGKVQIETPKTALETVVENCKNSCVMIYTYKDGKITGQGSGFGYNGYIITAKHVTDMGTSYGIYTDDYMYGIPGTIVQTDDKLDLAILKSNATVPSVKLGDSDKVKEGEDIVGITCPGGHMNYIDKCTAAGIRENDHKKYLGISDTFMKGGSSGGAIFNYNTQVIGMAVQGTEGVMDAVPINLIKPILDKLK